MLKTFLLVPRRGRLIDDPKIPDTDFATIFVTSPTPVSKATPRARAAQGKLRRWLSSQRDAVEGVDIVDAETSEGGGH